LEWICVHLWWKR